MKFFVQIKTDNAAFEDNQAAEVARLLREAADKVESDGYVHDTFRSLYDVNGNRVGSFGARTDDYEVSLKKG